MREDFDSVVAERFTVLEDVPVPDTWARAQRKVLDRQTFIAEETMIDLETPTRTEVPRKGPKRARLAAVLLAAAAAIAIAFVVILKDDTESPADQPSPTTTVPPEALFGTPGARLTAGTYLVDKVDGSPTPRILITLG